MKHIDWKTNITGTEEEQAILNSRAMQSDRVKVYVNFDMDISDEQVEREMEIYALDCERIAKIRGES